MRRVLLGSLLLLIVGAAVAWRHQRRDRLQVDRGVTSLPADGRLHRAMRLRLAGGDRLPPQDVLVLGLLTRVLPDGDGVVVEVASPVIQGQRKIVLCYKGTASSVALDFQPDATDSYGDGTPDFLRLHTAADRLAFRAWFTALAEGAAALPPDRLPREIDDCAALLRWCYRGALHAHDEAWQSGQPFETLPPLASVTQYVYPLTPLGTGLFRVRPGPYRPEDAANGAFAQFADAQALLRLNAYFVSRNLRAGRPGDLLFYRQLEQNSPFHSMILTGTSPGSGDNWAVYHTGPIGNARGAMRRVPVDDLLRHPDRRWRPLPENSNFLGVYRWNILREDGP